MKILISSIILFRCFFLIGCTQGSVVVMKEYKAHKTMDKKVTIVKLFDKATILNTDDVVDDLGAGVPDEVYNTFFAENFTTEIQKNWCCNKAEFVGKEKISGLEEKELEINSKEKMKILLPRENTKIGTDSLASDFFLFIDKPVILRTDGTTGTAIAGGMLTGGSFAKLYQSIYFAIWDNNNARIVSYGKVEANSDIVFAMTKGNWESVLNKIAKQIVYFSPFTLSRSVHFN